MKKSLYLLTMLFVFVSCNDDGGQEPEPGSYDVNTTFTVKGLENTRVKLTTLDGESFEQKLDASGSAVFTTPYDKVFEKMTVSGAEVRIGRAAGHAVSFACDKGSKEVVYREPVDGSIPIDIVEELVMVGYEANLTGSYRQMGDLHLDGIEWTPIGSDGGGEQVDEEGRLIEGGYPIKYCFQGDYDGNGYKIHNLHIEVATKNRSDYYKALFGVVGNVECFTNPTISNVTIASGSVKGYYYTAGVVARIVRGTVTNCVNHAAVSVSDNYAAGVVTQLMGNSTAEDCVNYGDIFAGMSEAGGVVEYSIASVVSNCRNYGRVSGANSVGGVVHFARLGTIEQCTNYGTVETGGSEVGGIAATLSGGNADTFARITNCTNSGHIRVGTTTGGGIVGGVSDGAVVENCENKGIVEYTGGAGDNAGGIGGIAGSCRASATILACVNRAESELRGVDTRVGGIVGFLNEAYIQDCTNFADISAVSVAGGIAGDNRGIIYRCTNNGDISVEEAVAGGIVGDNYDPDAKIRFCRNRGRISGVSLAGGIAGTNYGSCSSNINEGDIIVSDTGAGGICGAIFGPDAGFVGASYNTGRIEGADKVGGVAGYMNSNGLIQACYSTGEIDGTENVGGVCGSLDDAESTILASYWTGYDGKGVNPVRGEVFYFDDGTAAPADVATGWPVTSTPYWGLGIDGGEDNNDWWKNSGTQGTTDYPELGWE